MNVIYIRFDGVETLQENLSESACVRVWRSSKISNLPEVYVNPFEINIRIITNARTHTHAHIHTHTHTHS